MIRAIDIHTHVIPAEVPRWAERFGHGGFIRLEPVASAGGLPCRARMLRDDGFPFRDVEWSCWDPEVRLRDCDQSSVAVQVLSVAPVLLSYFAKGEHGLDVSRFLNDYVAGLVRGHPRRFAGLGTLPLQAPELAVRELERCVGELGLCGAMIGTHVNDWNLDAPELFPVFARAAELGACLFVHPWDMRGQEKMQKYWLPWLVGMPAEVSLAICSLIFGGVLERLPGLRLAFAYGGGSFPGTLGRIAHGFCARPDLVACDNPHPPERYLSRLTVDALVHDARALRLLVETFGAAQVAMGSDYPFPLGEQRPGALIRALGLGAAQERQLLQTTALKWMGRSAEEFALEETVST